MSLKARSDIPAFSIQYKTMITFFHLMKPNQLLGVFFICTNTGESLNLLHISYPAKLCTKCRVDTFRSCYSFVKGGQINGFA